MVGRVDARVHRQRLAIAAGLVIAVTAMGIVPRVALYGGHVTASAALHAAEVALDLSILTVLALRWPGRNDLALGWSGALVTAVGGGRVLLERSIEARVPGAMFPAVLYHAPPGVASSLVQAAIEGVLRVGLWALFYVFPMTLAATMENAARAERLRQAAEVARRRSQVEPTRVREALDGIVARIVDDPDDARERLADFAAQLEVRASDRLPVPASSHDEPNGDAAFAPSVTMVAPSVRTAEARRQFALALAALVLVVAMGASSRLLEHGRAALPAEALSFARLGLELAAFVAISEHAAARGRSILYVVASSAAATVALGIAVVLLAWRIEASAPGVLYPRSIYTHPPPVGRQAVRAVTRAALDVAFWTWMYVFPLASAEARRRELAVAALRREAELAWLRGSLAPHFVHNALNVIAGLVRAEPEAARRLIQRLSELLSTLGRGEAAHSLAEEIAWLRAYGELIEARFPDRLSVHVEGDRRADAVQVPRLLLQPLVENAVMHGALGRDDGGVVRVVAELVRGTSGPPRVRCVVEDNGPGVPPQAPREGIGLRLVRERLAAELTDATLAFDASEKGTRVVVEFAAVGAAA
jgi:hypothetical protein